MNRKRTKDDPELDQTRRAFQFEGRDGPIQYNVQLRRRNSSSALSLDDVLFELRFSENGANAKNTSLIGILNYIHKALFSLIEKLREFYPNSDGQERFVFITITSRAFTSNIFLGNEPLHGNNPLANKVLQQLFNCLVSYQELSISDAALNIHIVVHGRRYTQNRQARAIKRARKDNVHLNLDFTDNDKYGARGSNKGPYNLPPSLILTVPDYEKPICLLLAYTISYLFQKSYEKCPNGDEQLAAHLKHLHQGSKVNKTKYNESMTFLLSECQKLIAGTPLSLTQEEYELKDLCILTRKHSTVIYVFKQDYGNQLKWKYPLEKTTKLMPIFLYATTKIGGEPLRHMHALKNMPAMYDKNYSIRCCVNPTDQDHSCKVPIPCMLCRLPMANMSHYTNYNLTNKRMCTVDMKKMNVIKPTKCIGCQKVFRDGQCLQNHQKKYCHDSMKCQRCDVLLTAPRKRKNAKNADPAAPSPLEIKRAKHSCHEKICNLCYKKTSTTEQHQCRMASSKFPIKLRPTCYYDVETCPKSNEDDDSEHVPVMASALFELPGSCFGFYARATFCNGLLDFTGAQDCISLSGIKFDYIHPSHGNLVQTVPKNKQKQHRGRFPAKKQSRHYDLNDPSIEIKAQQLVTEYYQAFLKHLRYYEKARGIPKEVLRNPVTRLIIFFTIPSAFTGMQLIGHFASRFDSLFVMRSIWELGLDVRSLIQGLGYLNITLVSENIVFTDSFKMLTQPLAQLPDRFYFNPKLSKGFFPFQSLRLNKLNLFLAHRGLELKDYISFNDSESIVAEKTAFVKEQTQFHMPTALITYLFMDTIILQLSCNCFTQQMLHIQSILYQVTKDVEVDKNSLGFFYPFNSDMITLPQYGFAMLRKFGQGCFDMRACMVEGGLNQYSKSKQEMLWLTYLKHTTYPDLVTPYWSGQKMRKFNMSIPDGYRISDRGKITLAYFHGCVQHGHFDDVEKCTLLPHQSSKSSLNIYGEKYASVDARFQKKMEEIKKTWPIERILVEHSCKFLRDMNDKSTVIGQFFEKHVTLDDAYFKPRNIKQSLKGGRVSLLGNSVVLPFGSQYEAAMADFNSLYSSIAYDELFPTGEAKLLMGRENCQRHLRIGPTSYMYCHENEEDVVPISGVAYCSVSINPQNSLRGISFLAHRFEKKVYCALCRSCLYSQSQIPCQHTDSKDREFLDFFTLAELHYAQKELGDHNVVIYEAFFYTKLERIFAPYYRILAYHKMIYDAVDEDLVKNPEKLKAYLDDINEKMDLRGDLSLTPEKLQPNKSMRMTIKLLQNSGLGKYAQSTGKIEASYCSNDSRINELCNDPEIEIKNMLLVSEKMAEVTYETKSVYRRINLSGNIIYSALISAYGRIRLHRLFNHILKSSSASLLYADTDSVAFVKRKDEPLDLPIHSAAIGYLKYEHPSDFPRLASCMFLQPKSYMLGFAKTNSSKIGKQRLKLKGLTMKAHSLSKHIDQNTMHNLIRATCHRQLKKIQVPQHKFNIGTKREVKTQMITKTLSNKSGKRFLLPEVSLTRTFAYGSTEQDLWSTNSNLIDRISLENLAFAGSNIITPDDDDF